MDFEINPAAYRNIFAVPAAVVDENIRLASALQLKVLLFMLRRGDSPSCEEIAAALCADKADVSDAMIFWFERGLLREKDSESLPSLQGSAFQAQPAVPQPATPALIPNPLQMVARQEPPAAADIPKKPLPAELPISRPSHEQIAKRLEECKEFSSLFQEAQVTLGKTIGYDGQSVLIMMHDSYGLPFEVILMAVEYSVSQKKTGYSSIGKIGRLWSELGIDTLEGAMQYIEEHNAVNEVWNKLRSLTDIANRTPTEKQRRYLTAWVKEYGYGEDIIYYAYEESVDRTGKMSMPYMDKIIRSWHEKGVKTPMDIQRERADWEKQKSLRQPAKNPSKSGSKKQPRLLEGEASYDLESYKKKAYNPE